MDKSRANSKIKVVREVIEREEVDDDEDIPVSVRAHESGRIDPNKTVEEVVFGSGTQLDGAPVYTDWKQVAERQRRERPRGLRGQDESFHPLASSSFVDLGITAPIALDMTSPLDVSGISYPHVSFQHPPPAINVPSHPLSTSLPTHRAPAPSVPSPSRTLPLPGQQCPRVTSQPAFARFPPSAPAQFSASLPGVNTTSISSSREERLKQRLEDVENQIARVNVALESQGIETELSEESQLRLISFLQRRLLDLEAKVAEVDEYSGSSSGRSFEPDSLERGSSARGGQGQGSSLGRSRNSREEREENEHSVLFDLQELISREK